VGRYQEKENPSIWPEIKQFVKENQENRENTIKIILDIKRQTV